MPLRAYITAIQLNDGTHLDLPPTGVLAVVGPNNSGKSVALREIASMLTWSYPPVGWVPQVVQDVEFAKEGSLEELEEWLETHARGRDVPTSGRHYRRASGVDTSLTQLLSEWQGERRFGGASAQFFVLQPGIDLRGLVPGGGALWDPMNDTPSNTLQELYADPDLERRFSASCMEAFRMPIVLSRAPGVPLNLYIGVIDEPPATENLIANPAYLNRLRELPLLAAQGDGVRTFAGLLLSLMTTQYLTIFLDEPEAYLHPPQARLLGRRIAAEATGNVQVLLVTHSADLVMGLLDDPHANVTVARITREDSINPTSVLVSDQIRALWRDPLLRYSNVLDGLFHEGVIVCEADTDSRFYSSVLDSALTAAGRPPNELLFTQAGGYARMPTVLDALRAVRVPVGVILDIDVLRDPAVLERLLSILGGQFAELESDLRVIAAAVRSMERNPTVAFARDEINGILDREPDERISRGGVDSIRDAVRVDDGWRALKRAGVGALPQGDASRAAARVLDRLAESRIFVVPVGELERWEPEVAGHGPLWVAEVLTRELHARPDAPARDFVLRVARSFSVGDP